MTGQAASPFPVEALPDNRAGRLTDEQRRGLASVDRGWRKNELVGALIFAVVGVVVMTAEGPASGAVVRLVAGVAALIAAGFFVWRATPGGDPLSRDLAAGRVESVEGALGKRIENFSSSRGDGLSTYYFGVAGRSFEVGSVTYHAAPEAGIVRLYFLPRSHKVVNLERLADRPLPPGALDSPITLVKEVAAGLRSHDATQQAEARATMEAAKDAMQAENARRATPPPMEQRDPRPLREAILGTWAGGPVAIAFSGDGSASLTLNGRTQQGRWSVDHDGRLHADAMGHDQAADAWIVGDTLTIVAGATAVSYKRVAAG